MGQKIKVYAAKSLDEEVRFHSTSGGMFTELAKEVIKDGYLVAGARYNDQHMVEHDLIDCVNGIPLLWQSKYVQSYMGNIREKMKGKKVMFVGSPCQCSSVGADIKIDFVCHGVNSPKAYKSYLKMLESQYQSEVTKVWFKYKKGGWDRIITRIEFRNGKIYMQDWRHDLYMLGYLKHNLFMQERCYNCKFKGFPRHSDITLGDFWGYKKHDNKGLSLVIINTEKGQELFDRLDIWKKESDIEKAQRKNPCIYISPKKNPKHEQFMKDLDKYPFDECFRRCRLL